jgi:hypothetical protein
MAVGEHGGGPASNPLARSSCSQALAVKLLHHEMGLLSAEASLQLFRSCTGPMPASPGVTAELAKLEAAVAGACGGLVLALKVAGGQLWQQDDPAVWRVGSCLVVLVAVGLLRIVGLLWGVVGCHANRCEPGSVNRSR